MRSRLLPMLTLALALSPGRGALSEPTSAFPLDPFEAHYKVYGAGVPLGESVLSLTDTGDGHYRMRSEVRPSGLAALVVSDQISERASGEFRNGTIRPLSYEQQRSGGKKSGTTRLDFNWRDGMLHARSENGQVTLSLSPGVVDPLSLHLVVMWDLQQGRTPQRYTLVDDTELKTYQVQVDGDEIIRTPFGTLRTVRISRHKPGSSRTTILWFAPALKYLVVQIAQEKNGNEMLRMELEDVKGITVQK